MYYIANEKLLQEYISQKQTCQKQVTFMSLFFKLIYIIIIIIKCRSKYKNERRKR